MDKDKMDQKAPPDNEHVMLPQIRHVAVFILLFEAIIALGVCTASVRNGGSTEPLLLGAIPFVVFPVAFVVFFVLKASLGRIPRFALQAALAA